MNRATAMMAQGKQRPVGFDFTIPLLFAVTHHVEQDGLMHGVGLLERTVNDLRHKMSHPDGILGRCDSKNGQLAVMGFGQA